MKLLSVYLLSILATGTTDGWLFHLKSSSPTLCRIVCPSSWSPHHQRCTARPLQATDKDDEGAEKRPKFKYDLGIGKNRKFDNGDDSAGSTEVASQNWLAPEPVVKPRDPIKPVSYSLGTAASEAVKPEARRTRRMLARDEESRKLRAALWDERHYSDEHDDKSDKRRRGSMLAYGPPQLPSAFYPDIDLSIPQSVYSDDGSVDLVWELLRWEAYEQAQREPLLVSFLHSTILNHPSLESSLAFLLANRLQSPAMMISTQLQSLILDALQHDVVFRRSLRADMMAVRDRDPACSQLPDVFLYFKGFHALQSYRVSHYLWKNNKQVLAQFLQSQVSQTFQIDIHPNATLGSGILVDHGTGVVIGSTASVGSNCSILHHVTLGGSGKKGVDRHPKVGDGVLLGAGATVLGPVHIGEGCQIGAGTLVISDLPAHSVAVGVPARIIGSFVDVTEQPSVEMNQMMDARKDIVTFESEGI